MSPVTRPSAAVAVQDAIVAALRADVALRAFLRVGELASDLEADAQPSPRIWETRAPAGQGIDADREAEIAPRPYLVLGEATEDAFALFHAPGSDDTLRVRVWATSEREAKLGYAHVHRILDGQPLALATLGVGRGLEVRLLRCVADPDGAAVQAVADVRLTALDD